MDKVITVVVPTYNMELYLNRCLDSLILKEKDLLEKVQVLVVNDGSKDSSLVIAQDYEKQYPATFQVINKSNGNYGSCVNAALCQATGKYFRLLDADDLFFTEGFYELVKGLLALEDEVDLVITNYCYEMDCKQLKCINASCIDYNKIYSIDDMDLNNNGLEEIFRMHGITYRTDILKECELTHSEGISYTDSEYCFYPWEVISKIKFFNLSLYRYQLGRDEQTVSDESYFKCRNHLYLIIIRMLKYWMFKSFDKQMKAYENQKIVFLRCLSVYYGIILTNKRNEEDNCKIEEIDKLILNWDKNLYLAMNSFKKYRLVPFMLLWRKCDIYSSSFLFQVFYQFAKVLKKCWRI